MFFKGVSRPRNRGIMRIFHDVDMVEQLGSGMNRILQYYDKGIFEIYEDTIKVVFRFAMSVDDAIPNGSEIVQDASNSSKISSRKKVSKETIKAAIVSYLRNNPKATYQEIGENFEMKRTTVFNYLNELVEDRIIERIGNNRSGYWKVL